MPEGPRIVVLGPVRLRERIISALAREAVALTDEPSAATAAFVHAHAGGPGKGPERLASLCARGLSPCLGVVPARAAAARDAFHEAGAADVLADTAGPQEIARTLARALAAAELAARVRQQDRQLLLVSALARRLLRPCDPHALLHEALDAVAGALGAARAEIRVLPDGGTDSPVVLAARWERGRAAARRAHEARLDRDDLEALRRREPVTAESGASVLPLVSRGRPCGVLRIEPGPDGLESGDLETLYGIGNLLADALAHVEQIARLTGRSRDLEALVADRGRAAEEQRVLFQAVVDALPVSLHVVDRAHRIVVWNRGREAGPLGRPRGEMLGRNLFDEIGADAELLGEYDDVFRTGRPRTTEVASAAQGTERIYAVEKVPMRLGSGSEVTHVVTFARDVTAQRGFERTIAETERLAAVGRLAAGIAHEINNPLATIAGCAEALRMRLAEGAPATPEALAELSEDAAVIESEAYRCKDILGGVLDFSRASADRRTACDPAEIVQRAVRLLRHNPRTGGVALKVETADGLPAVHANADQLVQVLLSLAVNGADAAAPSGSVTIRAQAREDGVVFAVEDDGPGIPAEIRARIFEPFFTTKPPGQGTGLGLSVAYGLVQAHGGRLEVVSQPGFGSRFEVVLPPCEEAEAVAACARAPGKAAAESDAAGAPGNDKETSR